MDSGQLSDDADGRRSGSDDGGGEGDRTGATALDLQTVFDGIALPTILLDANADLVVWNDAAADLIGVDRAGATGGDETIGERLYDGDRSKILAERVLAHPENAHEVYDGVELTDEEYSTFFPDGVQAYEDQSTIDASGAEVWFAAAPVYAAGEIAGVIEFVQDRSESERRRQEMEALIEELSETLSAYGDGEFDARASFDTADTLVDEDLVALVDWVNDLGYELQYMQELERSNEKLQQFAYIASHDLQEPLRMVSSYLELLADEYGGELDEEADEYIEFAVDGAERMQAMIDALLTYSRVETHAEPFETVDADEVLDRTIQDLELLVGESDAAITRDPLPTVRADPNQLGQLLQNLVKNAIEHGSADEATPAADGTDGAGGSSTSVHVTGGEREGEYWIAVEDDGVGIPADQQDRVFEIFTKGNRDGEGTGIGLAVCDRIASRHGGDLTVDSEPGEGTTFTVTIPKRPDRRSPGPRSGGEQA